MNISKAKLRLKKQKCTHEYKSLGIKESKGLNLLGELVKCKIEDFICNNCNDTIFKFRGAIT